VSVRAARDGDWNAILDVHRRAFADEGEAIVRLCGELRELGLVAHSFVAEADGEIVGNVLNDWVTIEESGERLLQLSPLGVVPEAQRRGHGGELVRAALEAARGEGEPLLLVEGSPAYYGRFGFVRADELGLRPPPEALYDWAFQVAPFVPADELPQGRVAYPEPFRH
jgi:putative acetyltransferase